MKKRTVKDFIALYNSDDLLPFITQMMRKNWR